MLRKLNSKKDRFSILGILLNFFITLIFEFGKIASSINWCGLA
jgi:hypothetical protein